MGKKSGPPAPDYGQIAGQQGQIARQLTDQQTAANRPTVYTPWGSQTWTRSPGGTRAEAGTATNGAQFDAQRYLEANPDVAQNWSGNAYEHFQRHGVNEGRQGFWQDITVNAPDSWEQRITLSPEQQAALDSQMAIQRGRSQGAQTLLDQAIGNFQSPMNWNAMPARAEAVSAPSLGGDFGNPNVRNLDSARSRVFSFGGGGDASAPVAEVQGIGPLAFSAGDPSAPNASGPQAGNLVTGVAQRGTVSNVNAGNIQSQLNQSPGQWRQSAQDAVWNLQRPMLEEQRAGLENQLANQGLARGSEAWNREMRRMDDSFARAQLQAIETGRGEAAQMFGQDLAAGQFANAAQAQEFGQGMSNAGLFNVAQQQMFGQDMANAGLSNAAQGQRFGQDLQRLSFENSAAQQAFQNRLSNAGLQNQAAQQQFAAGMQQGNFANQAAQQTFNNTFQNNQFANQAGQQLFAQEMAQRQFENQAGQQQFENMNRLAQLGDSRAAQQLDMMLRAGAFNNQNRQQAISEEQMRRGQTLNELNALLTGQQVSMPQMPSFVAAGRAETPNLLGAAGQQYQSSIDAYNAGIGNMNNLIGTAANLGSMAFMFSDARLKEDIQYTGSSIGGIPVVHYRYRGLPGRYIGVIAQDVLLVKPEAVALHPSGFLMVNYQGLA